MVDYTPKASSTFNTFSYNEEPALPYDTQPWLKRSFLKPEILNNFSSNNDNEGMTRQELKTCSCVSSLQNEEITTKNPQLKEQGMHDDTITQ